MGIGARELIFSVNCFAAAMLALYVSFAIGLERPFWAMATVYITSQLLSGAVRSKAVYRLAGTILGAGVTVAVVVPLANAPLLLSLAIAGWVSACLYISLLDRTPRSYLFMLAGYTAALIGFPSVSAPAGVFDTAVLRAEEIGLGVACAAFVHAIVFPMSVGLILAARIKALLGEAEAWVGDILDRDAPFDRAKRDRRRLASDLTELHLLASHLPFDTAAWRPGGRVLAALQDQLVMLLPLASAIEDRIHSLAGLGPIDADIVTLTVDVRRWVIDAAADNAMVLRARCAALSERPGIDSWSDLLRLNLADRLAELIEALNLARELVFVACVPGTAVSIEARAAIAAARTRPLHLDHGMALLSSAGTMAAILGVCIFWIATGWSDGAAAAAFAAVACCFYATMDDPVPAQRGFLIWIAIGLLLATLYVFGILPRVTDFATLALTLAPACLASGVLMAKPRWYQRMVPMMLGFAGGMALTNDFRVDPSGFFNANVAQLVGVATAMAVTRLFRSIGSEAAIYRLRRAGWRDLATLARNPPPPGWGSRMLDRVGLIALRIREAGPDEEDAAAEGLRELRLGLNLMQIAEVSGTAELRDAIGRHYATATRARSQPPATLLDEIDRTIATYVAEDNPRLLAALTGLRRNIFPAAPVWHVQENAA